MAPQWLRAFRLQAGDWVTVAVCVAFLGAAWVTLYTFDEELPRYLQVKESIFTTLLEVIPAVIVAVAIFAAGTILVIAQLISAALGSRAVLALLTDSIARSGVIAGMLLLVASLAVATSADLPDEPGWEVEPADEGELRVTPAQPERLSKLLSSFAVALSISTALYVLWAMLILVVVVWRFVDPRSYSADLARARRRATDRRTVEDLYRRIRALRQWLRTAAAAGESRDLVFALLGMEGLLLSYQRSVAKRPQVRSLVPGEYEITRALDDDGRRAVVDLRQKARTDLYLDGWFGAELGRALVRGLEVGMRGQLLRRDADRIINTLTACIRLSTVELGDGETHLRRRPRTRPQLPDDAGYLIDRLAEAGLFCRQIDAKTVWRHWFENAASRLADLEKEFERGSLRTRTPTLDAQPTVDPDPTEPTWPLAARALAGWCAVQKALDVKPGLVHVSRLGEHAEGRETTVWDPAIGLAEIGAISPTWLPGQKGPATSASSPGSDMTLADYVKAAKKGPQPEPTSSTPTVPSAREGTAG